MFVFMVYLQFCAIELLLIDAPGVRITWLFICLQVPVAISNLTVRLFLDKNLLICVPANSFLDLRLLAELDLSHNQISLLEAGCFSGLDSLHFLDLSSNCLTTLDPLALGGLRVHANLTCNAWHCDCKLQVSMLQLDLDLASLAKVVCLSSDLPNLGMLRLLDHLTVSWGIQIVPNHKP
ncbi:leucine-rich repeat-containing protein 3C-like [Thalassophryne amazonica]|uniref:leucine-rich repeat-containing protein 3C-like n=1 Tax=Thalassophryne amazonica TaxID=390379 RepID=UPI00147242FD|nr:leucine-rich repeat-containing protein 3C-like [Thalassophryne amazonica]